MFKTRHFLFGIIAAFLLIPFINPQTTGDSEDLLGKVNFPVSCSADIQQEFNNAVALLHHMTYPRAKTAFEKVAAKDPGCAMAYWGMAMTLFQPLWPTRPGREELEEGLKLILKAKELAPADERERLFIASAEAFFLEPGETDYWKRIGRWKTAMETLYEKYPDDHEVKAFYSLALLSVAQTSDNPLEYHNSAAEILLSIYSENPEHPGALHYTVHANDITGREHESLGIVRKYAGIAPRNPHALHMPTHIFTRLGSWEEVIEYNLKAAEAALEHPSGEHGEHVWDEFPHAIEYLVYAYLQQGNEAAAEKQLQRLLSTAGLHPTFKTAFHISSVPVRYAVERKEWKEAAELIPRNHDKIEWDLFPWPEALTWFAKGLANVHLRRLNESYAAVKRLQELEGIAESKGEKLFTAQIKIMRLEAGAWIAFAEGNEERAVELMNEAVKIEISSPKHPVTPGPVLPAYELLGDLLIESGMPGDALNAYKQSLELYPKRFNSLLGAARSADKLGNKELAVKFYNELIEISYQESDSPGVKEARTYFSNE